MNDNNPREATMAPGFGSTSKIRDAHLNRLAMVYVRQSTPQQVIENRESRERQYALAQFAQRLGWPAERVVVIDEDQGQSGKTAAERSGFQRLMTEVSLSHVGIILGLELSRLSRSNKDWHQLIDVCGIFNTLLCDQDAVYDPLDSNDRLLLGMRGAMSEYELITLRNRLLRGSRNKAERGELFLHVPVGYFKTPTGEMVQEPDEQARNMVRLVFDKFEELGSAYSVFRYFTTNQLQLGFRPQSAACHGELQWRTPSPNRILGILHHPIYAGAYAYGVHKPGHKNPLTGHRDGGKWFLQPDEIPVLLRDRLPAYISWDQYLANRERLKQNRTLHDTRGTPRRGGAVPYLALIVFPSEYSRIAIRFPNLSYTHNSANSTTPNELATPLFDPAPRSTFRTSYLATTPPLPHAGTITIFAEASVWAASCNGSTAAPRIGARWPNNSNSRTVPTARPSALSFSMASCTDSTRPVPTEKPSAPVASSAATAMSGPVAGTLSASGSSTKSDGSASPPKLSGAFSNAPLPVPLPPQSAPPTAT